MKPPGIGGSLTPTVPSGLTTITWKVPAASPAGTSAESSVSSRKPTLVSARARAPPPVGLRYTRGTSSNGTPLVGSSMTSETSVLVVVPPNGGTTAKSAIVTRWVRSVTPLSAAGQPLASSRVTS